MAAICQFHQHGHCKFAVSCNRIHTMATCDSFPCLASICHKRHPKRCRYYDLYGRCKFAEQCSFLHYRGHDQMTSEAIQVTEQEVAALKEEIKSLMSEIIRLRKETDTQFNSQNENNKQLLEMIKDIREDLDVARAVRRQNEISSPETCAENEGDAVTCMAFPCMDNTCRKHYTVEGHFRVYNVKGKGRDERRGDKTDGKNVCKGKSAAPHKSVATSRTPGVYHGPGRGQK